MARSSSLLQQKGPDAACVLLAVASTLCFVGMSQAPTAGGQPLQLQKSLRAPAVQMEARGGGEGALGDMSPDTYIIGITLFGIVSLVANMSGFFNP